MKRNIKQDFIASVTDAYLNRIDQVAGRLEEMGCDIRQILKISGVITGKVSKDISLDTLRIKGIASIEKQKAVKKK